MTWNILRGQAGIEPIAAFIREQKPDVVFLQEVLRPEYAKTQIDFAEEIANRIDGLRDYSVTSLCAGNIHKWGDPAILSRWPVKEARFIDAGDGGRSYGLLATLDVPGDPFHLVCVHTNGTWKMDVKHAVESALARHGQIKHLLSIVRELAGDAIIAGDFNTPEWMPEYRLMCDAWTDFGREFNNADLRTFPSDAAHVRIDYVFGRGELSAERYEVLESPHSDHRAVVADLVIRKGATSRPQDRRYGGSPSTSE